MANMSPVLSLSMYNNSAHFFSLKSLESAYRTKNILFVLVNNKILIFNFLVVFEILDMATTEFQSRNFFHTNLTLIPLIKNEKSQSVHKIKKIEIMVRRN